MGGLTLDPSSNLNFELGSSRDHIVITGGGNVYLGGALNVSLLDGFTPTSGQSFSLFEGAIGTVTGSFSSINMPIFGDLTLQLVQDAGSIMLNVVDSPVFAGDFNRDGTVNSADLINWRGGFGLSSLATHAQGDADGNADVDGSDFLIWQRQFGHAGAALQSAASTPEPATMRLTFLGLMACAWLRPRRRRKAVIAGL